MSYTPFKVKGAPFEYNGRFWTDDPTRILTREDYEDIPEGFEPFDFGNGVEIFEFTQLFKKVFWEKISVYPDYAGIYSVLCKLPAVERKRLANQCRHMYVNNAHVFTPDHQYYTRADSAVAFLQSVVENPFQNYYERASRNFSYYSRDASTVTSPVRRILAGVTNNSGFFLIQPEGKKSDKPVRIVTACWGTSHGFVVSHSYTELYTLAGGGDSSEGPGVRNYSYDATQLGGFKGVEREGPLSSTSSAPFLGVELEVCTKVSAEELIKICTDVEPKQEIFFVCKSDGSIAGNFEHKYEIVTVPLTPSKMRREWRTLMQKLERLSKDKGLTLYGDVFDTTNSTGVHVHISKKSFSYGKQPTPILRKAGLAWGSRFLAAFNSDFREEMNLLRKVSGRPDYTTNQYCGLSASAVRGRRVAYRVGAKYLSEYGTKYSPAHGGKPSTYEVRIFSGEVSLQHMLSAIDLIDAMYTYTCSHSATSCVRFAAPFTAWLSKTPGYLPLKKTLGLK